MNYTEALTYIHSVNWTFCKPGLERIRTLCDALGNPQDSLRFVHVAGTNGKGSTCSMLDSILRASGLHTGRYTSPYIRFFNERMCVDGEPISDEELAEITTEVRPIADAMTDRPTEFELITAVAFVYFKRHACDVVILETGMGGRLDSTNIIRNPLLSIITGIALDHTAFLGDTVEAIAAEKAGIIKDSRPILWGGDDPSAAAVIAEAARREGSTFSAVDYGALGVTSADLSGTVFDLGERRGLSIRLLGAYQPRNACIAVRAAELLADEGLPITDASIREGLAAARWSGRFELLTHDPLMIFDGAHNPQGIRAAVESIERYFTEKVYLLTGVLRDKDYTAIAADLATVAKLAFTITPQSPRALSATEYAETLRHAGMDATAYESLREGLSAAREAAARDGVPLVCLGSLYLYADLVSELEAMEG